MQITITGKLGSGKSTVCRLLSQRFGFEVFSTGDLHRGLAKKMGLDTIALNRLMGTDRRYDRLIDDEVVSIARSRPNDRIIFDSRLAWHFVEKSFKIFTTIDPMIAAKRVLASPRGEEETYTDEEDVLCKLKLRSNLEKTRFKEIYGVDYLDYRNFNLILDTTWFDPDSVLNILSENYSAFTSNSQPFYGKIIISPKSLYPTAPLARSSSPAPEDNFASKPLKVVCKDCYHYVVDDDGSLGLALSENIPYVHAVLAQHADFTVFDHKLPKELITQAEAKGCFSYASLPDVY
jgi:cytidylate kinase